MTKGQPWPSSSESSVTTLFCFSILEKKKLVWYEHLVDVTFEATIEVVHEQLVEFYQYYCCDFSTCHTNIQLPPQ